MTIEFNPPVAVYSAERTHTAIANYTTFIGVEGSFAASTEFTEKKINGESYIGAVKFFDQNGEYGGTVKVSTGDQSAYSDAIDGLNVSMAERAFDDGATATEDVAARNWQAVLNGEIPATGDSFRMRVFIGKVVASNYKNQATIDTLETWCHTYIGD